jgi:hypothetical protein
VTFAEAKVIPMQIGIHEKTRREAGFFVAPFARGGPANHGKVESGVGKRGVSRIGEEPG